MHDPASGGAKRVFAESSGNVSFLLVFGRRGLVWGLASFAIALMVAASELWLAVGLAAAVSSLTLEPNETAHTNWFGLSVWGMLLLAIVVRALGQVAIVATSAGIHVEVSRHLKTRLLDRLLLTPQSLRLPATFAIVQLTEHVPRAAQAAQAWVRLAAGCLQILVVAAAIVWVEPSAVVLVITGLAVIGGLVLYANRRVHTLANKLSSTQQEIAQALERITRSLPLLHVLRTGRLEHASLKAKIDEYARSAWLAAFTSNVAGILPVVLGGVVLVLFLGNALEEKGASGAVVVAYLVVRLVMLLINQVTTWSVLTASSASMRRIRGEWTEVKDDLAESSQPLSRPSAAPPSITAQRVSFRYQDGPKVLDNVSFRAAAGDIVGIIGPSGAGKSTLAKLLLGLLSPADGSLLMDGLPPVEYFERVGRAAYVGSDPFLFAGTLRENLHYGADGVPSDTEIFAALSRAQVDSVVFELPGALDYELVEGGEGLSSGERQRLALARALLRNPNVLVLDEITANLDEATEESIARTVEILGRDMTRIVIAHRAAMLKHCDVTIRLTREGYVVKNAMFQEG